MRYEGKVFRPPSEARSLILQCTIGCSHNKCTFCNMYKDDEFKIRNIDEIIEDINRARKYYKNIGRIFLADGDALMMKTENLLKILNHIKLNIPECERIGIYASPKSIMIKSPEELKTLHKAGLGIAYLGLESGSDRILKEINKGANSKEIIESGIKIKNSGILLSVTLISGLGGRSNWKEHAISSAIAINEMKPDYLGLLTLMIEPGTKLYEDIQNNIFEIMSPEEIALETLEMLEHLDAEGCVFRSNHASNYLSLRGTLNQDKKRMISEIQEAINDNGRFKAEWMRGL